MKPDLENSAEQWRIHRKNLDDLEIRKAKYGLDAPTSLLRQMDDEKAALVELEQRLQELQRPSHEVIPQEQTVGTKLSRDKYNNKLKIFLCHSSDDKQRIKLLYNKLQETNADTWLDSEKLLPGQDWELEISRAVKKADVVIVCLSKNSVSKSGYIQKEFKFALNVADEKPDGTIFIIPLKLEECIVPDRLAKWQWLNYYEDNAYTKLLSTLKVRAEQLGIEY